MKKSAIILTALLSASLLSACSSSNDTNWKSDIEVPPEVRAEQEGIMEKHYAILENDPKNFTAIFEIAYRNDLLGNYKEAEKWYLKALEIEMAPKDQATLNNLATLYEKVGEIESAKKYVQMLYESYPNQTEVIRDSVRIFAKAGEIENAQGILDTYVKFLGDDAEDEAHKKLIESFQEIINNYK